MPRLTAMSAAAGWYPDPAGQPGMYRYWDGRSWSAAVSPHPGATAPAGPIGGSPKSSQPGTQPVGYQSYGSGGQVPIPPPKRRGGYWWLIGIAAVLVVLVVVVVMAVRLIAPEVGQPTTPTGRASSEVCPKPQSGSPDPQMNDGRVHAGKLSYPTLGPPWSSPAPEYRVAFGRGVLIQSVEIERSGSQGWLAAVLLGGLVAGDGFFTPQDGAAIVVKCVAATFYGNSAVTRDDKVNKAMKVDGHDAWIIESQLGFDVLGIKAKSERLIVVIVDTGADAGLFYASIPENAPELVQPARDALAALRVDR
jgi:hypothetical protein